jgi:hypothetical protein
VLGRFMNRPDEVLVDYDDAMKVIWHDNPII